MREPNQLHRALSALPRVADILGRDLAVLGTELLEHAIGDSGNFPTGIDRTEGWPLLDLPADLEFGHHGAEAA